MRRLKRRKRDHLRTRGNDHRVKGLEICLKISSPEDGSKRITSLGETNRIFYDRHNHKTFEKK